MIAYSDIEDLGKRIGAEFHPKRVILFGSYANGQATDESDVDLFVEMDHPHRTVDAAVEIRMQTRPNFPCDIIVRNSREIDQRIMMGDPFVQNIISRGTTLYEAID
jgi:predicted nucleotidyltransferase